MHIADPEQAETDIQVSLTLPAKSPKIQPILCSFKDRNIYAGAPKPITSNFKNIER